MDNKVKQNKTFSDLPAHIQDFLLSQESIGLNKEISQKFAFSDKQRRFYLKTLLRIYLQEIPLEQLKEALEVLGLGSEKTKKLALEILKKKILPLSDYLKIDVLSYIKDLGGEIPADEMSELVKRKSQGKIDADQAMKDIEQSTGLKLEDNVLRNRFKNVLISFLRNVRSPLETIIVLKRSPKIGGLGLSSEKADQVMKILRQKESNKNLSQKGSSGNKNIDARQNSTLNRKKIVDSSQSKKLIENPLVAEDLLRIETRSNRTLLGEKKKKEKEKNIETQEKKKQREKEIFLENKVEEKEEAKEEAKKENKGLRKEEQALSEEPVFDSSVSKKKNFLSSEETPSDQKKVVKDIEEAMKNFTSVSSDTKKQEKIAFSKKKNEEKDKKKKNIEIREEKKAQEEISSENKISQAETKKRNKIKNLSKEKQGPSSLPFLEKSSGEAQKESRKKIEGVSTKPRIYGPVDQLKSISLI
ncbi:MAG TPA: hypothetical protein VJ895_01255, partial [Candidatus Nanoarchaeia archaeon]|nr:hypothetical protein [Candidatus Nanoarchaeia archaeon]